MEKTGDNSQLEPAANVTKPDKVNPRVSKAIEEEEAFLEYIMSLPAMSTENIEAFKKKQVPVLVRSTSECAGGLEHLENLYKLMEHLGQLRKQNSKLQKRVKYLENIAQEEIHEGECDDAMRIESRRKRSSKYKPGCGIRQSLIRNPRERSRSVGVEEMVKSRQIEGIKSKVSKWTKVKEAFRWEKVLLPEAASQDSGLGGGEYLRVPSDQSSFSVSPADSVLSGPQPLSSTSNSEDELEMDALSAGAEAGHKQSGSIDGATQMRLGTEDQDSRSKSLDGDTVIMPSCIADHQITSKECKSSQHFYKSHKTPWSKVKDIIQTRTGSIKKKRSPESGLDEEVILPGDLSGSEDNKDFEDKLSDAIQHDHIHEISETGLVSLKPGESLNKKRLAPVLTITLPSTEELRTHDLKSDTTVTSPKVVKPPPSPQLDEKHTKFLVKQRTLDETTSRENYKKQVSSSSAGTSPPTPRRQSKWSKVKNAFLTTAPSPEYMLNHGSNSVPSSPIKHSSFTYDLESDDLSSGEFVDESLRDANDDVFPESTEDNNYLGHCETSSENIRNEIKRNFEELQMRLSHEFHQKLNEWEKLKNSGAGTSTPSSAAKIAGSGMSSGTSSVGDDDRAFRKKMDEWDKIKSPKQRELALQHLGEENLTPDFKKKLEQWEKLKSIPVSPTPDSSFYTQPQFKKKIAEWQRWRTAGGSSNSGSKVDAHFQSNYPDIPDDFTRKLLEWEKLKQGIGENDNLVRPGNRSPSPSSLRKDFSEHKSKKCQSRCEIGHKIAKSKSHNEVKELAWLEKELHKIEREKQRLERERDKYMEREARLEKMRKALGTTQQKQEILIPTSTGLFRFEGISQKFTRKLYEWEKAKGIGPEASTFALLDPGYQPPSQSGQSYVEGVKKNGTFLMRSKSVGSVVDVTSSGTPAGITHQPSSLSLNNMDEIDNADLEHEIDQQISQGELCVSDTEEPEAVIVDIEDVVEETASPLIEQPVIVSETPVYCYAPEEVTHLIDSSGSENDLGGGEGVQSSYIILQENMHLLDKLQKKEDICRKLEFEMENLEEQMNSTARNKEQKLEKLELAEPTGITPTEGHTTGEGERELQEIKAQLQLIEQHQEELRHEEKSLQCSFVEHSEQQAVLAQNLVDKMRQLQEVNSSMTPTTYFASINQNPSIQQQEALAKVQDLTSQLLNMAERLENIMGERSKELWRIKDIQLPTSRSLPGYPALSHHSFSTDSITTSGIVINKLPRQNSEELSKLPGLLTNKVLELKRGLSYLCAVSDVSLVPEVSVVAEGSSKSLISSDEEKCSKYADNGSMLQKCCNQSINSMVSGRPRKNSTSNIENVQQEPSVEIIEEAEPYLQTTTFTFPSPGVVKRNVSSDKKDEEIKRPVLNIVNEEPKKQLKKYTLCIREDEQSNSQHSTSKTNILPNISCEKKGNTQFQGNVTTVEKPSTLVTAEYQKLNNNDEMGSKKGKRIKRFVPLEKSNKSLDIRERNHEGDDEILLSEDDSRLSSKKLVCSKNGKYKRTLKTRQVPEIYLQSGIKPSKNLGTKSSEIKSVENIEPNLFHEFPGNKTVNINEEESKKGHKTFSEKMSNLSSLEQDTENYQIDMTSSDSGLSTQASNMNEMTVNVFVPTTRKIFSPVRRDSKGKTSSVISYVVKDHNSVQEVKENKTADSTSKIHDKPNEPNLGTATNTSGERNSEDSHNRREEINFILPPCWILRETRAQSASPALQRRHFPSNKKRDAPGENRENLKRYNKTDDANNRSTEKKSNDETVDQVTPQSSDQIIKHDNKLLTCRTPPLPKRERPINRDNSSSESSPEHLNPSESKISSSNRKSRTEVGFPPISPIPSRRDTKITNKEAAPSIRMMIARYNRKVTESQELVGTKSPDSGGAGSPVAWRSPVTERRVKAQMEKYQEEVRKVLQGSGEKRRDIIGEVKKSASTSLIRPWDKCGLQDGFQRRPSDGLPDRPSDLNYRGILKSSSAGSIKPSKSTPNTPLPLRNDKINMNENDSMRKFSTSSETKNSEELQCVSLSEQTSSTYVSSKFDCKSNAEVIYPQSSPESSRLRALRLKKAKEEFLRRGPGGGSWSSECSAISNTASPADNIVQWSRNKSRLSQISCESDCSYEGILVSGEEQRQDTETRLLVKSASAGMINVDPAALSNILPESASNTSVPSGSSELGAIGKSNRFGLSHLASRFRRVRMRRNKDKDKDNQSKMETVSALCRQSLLIDLQRNRSTDRKEAVSSSKSCPSSPVLQKRDSASSWILKPHRIFKPK